MFKQVDADEIVIGFSTCPGNPIAWAIRHFEDTPFSHVYMRYYALTLNRHMVYQSNIDNVNFTNERHFNQHNIIIDEYAFKISPEIKTRVLQKCIDRLHLKYGKVQLIGMALIRVWYALTGERVSNPLQDKEKTQVCSELMGHVLIEMGFDVDESLLESEGPRWLHKQVEAMLEAGLCRKL